MVTASFFKALGDPTRLEMIERLASGNMYTINTVSSGLDITRQGARKHIQLLADAHVITLKPSGRQTLVSLDMQTIKMGEAFIAQLESRWDSHLAALRKYVDG